MPEKRVVMRCEVVWVTDDSNDIVREAFRQYDESGRPSPIDFVEAAIRWASTGMDWSVETPTPGSGLEIRVSGPESWSVAFDRPKA